MIFLSLLFFRYYNIAEPHYFDADPTFHFDEDPNLSPDPCFQLKAQNLEKVLK